MSKMLERSELESKFTSDSATLMKTLDVHEGLVGLYETRNTKEETTTKLNKVSVCRLGLDLNDCRGQGHDGASNMNHACRMVACLEFKHENTSKKTPKAILFTPFVIL